MTDDAQASETVAPAPAPRRRSAAGLVVVVLAAAAGAALTFPQWRDKIGLPEPEPGFEEENLRAELSGLTSRLAQLEARPANSSPSDDGRLAALEQAVKAASPAGLGAEFDSLAKQVDELRRGTADAAALNRLADRVEKVESALRELQAKRASAAALLLSVGQLREAVNLGQPFDAESRAVRVLAGEDAELAKALEVLRERAAQGVKTRAALADSFTTLAPGLIRAEILPEDDGWKRRVADKMLTLVSVRREDGAAAGETAPAVVARAQAALSRQDLPAAVAELAALSPSAAEACAPWLAEAKARLAADKALSELAAQAIALAGAKP